MSLNGILTEVLAPIAPTKADEYTGESETYIVFNYNSNPSDYGDDEPGHEVFSVQVHLYAPPRVNILAMRREIKQALFGAGFTWPHCVNASDSNGQHHVYECEIAQPPDVE